MCNFVNNRHTGKLKVSIPEKIQSILYALISFAVIHLQLCRSINWYRLLPSLLNQVWGLLSQLQQQSVRVGYKISTLYTKILSMAPVKIHCVWVYEESNNPISTYANIREPSTQNIVDQKAIIFWCSFLHKSNSSPFISPRVFNLRGNVNFFYVQINNPCKYMFYEEEEKS